ncbi:MAG: hypothetical protein R2809_07135 [Flavobacteriales bacterium]
MRNQKKTDINLYSVVRITPVVLIWVVAIAQRIEQAAGDVSAGRIGPLDPQKHTSSTELRKVTWSAAIQVMQEKTLGAGVGSTSKALNKIYESKGQY